MLFLLKSTLENEKRKQSEHFGRQKEPMGSQTASRLTVPLQNELCGKIHVANIFPHEALPLMNASKGSFIELLSSPSPHSSQSLMTYTTKLHSLITLLKRWWTSTASWEPLLQRSLQGTDERRRWKCHQRSHDPRTRGGQRTQ